MLNICINNSTHTYLYKYIRLYIYIFIYLFLYTAPCSNVLSCVATSTVHDARTCANALVSAWWSAIPGTCRQHGRTHARVSDSQVMLGLKTRTYASLSACACRRISWKRSCGGDPLALELLDPPREVGEV